MKQKNNSVNFQNCGFIMKKIPDYLFNELKRECSYIENLRRNNINEERYNLETALESNNQAKHYSLVNCRHILCDYVSHLVKEYEESFPSYINSVKILSDNVPFSFEQPWVNIQSKGEFLPLHGHCGIYSYSIWIKIPYSYEKENSLSKYICNPVVGSFQFVYTNCLGGLENHCIPLSPDYEGYMLFFPSNLKHIVNPFFTSDEYRISISGNVLLDTSKYKVG